MTLSRLGVGPANREHPTIQLSSLRAAAFPLVCAASLAVVGILDIHQNQTLRWSIVVAAGLLALWSALLFASAKRSGRILIVEIVARRQHYLQACAQGSVLLYWGWYWREVYLSIDLIVAQLLFAYGFDMLLGWSRRDTYTLGFGPFPVVFSINLFLWFKPDWFYFQFLMVATGFAAKQIIHWYKEGRSTHIFNPSAFTLALFAIALLLTGRSDIS